MFKFIRNLFKRSGKIQEKTFTPLPTSLEGVKVRIPAFGAEGFIVKVDGNKLAICDGNFKVESLTGNMQIDVEEALKTLSKNSARTDRTIKFNIFNIEIIS